MLYFQNRHLTFIPVWKWICANGHPYLIVAFINKIGFLLVRSKSRWTKIATISSFLPTRLVKVNNFAISTGWPISLMKTSRWLRFEMFRHPAWAVGSYSSGPPAAETVGTKSTGGFHQGDGSPCIALMLTWRWAIRRNGKTFYAFITTFRYTFVNLTDVPYYSN